jgi:serpin B
VKLKTFILSFVLFLSINVLANADVGMVQSNNEFAINLYKQLQTQNQNKNIFFSPFSLYMAFGMVYEGASGNTAKQIQSVFKFDSNDKNRLENFSILYNILNQQDSTYKLSLANAFWVVNKYPILKSYTDILKDYYHAAAYNLDFCGNPSDSANQINKWASDNTNNKINQVIKSDDLNCLTKLVLTNAVYFKGQWGIKFDESLTKESDFFVNPNEVRKVPMMHIADGDFKYMQNDVMQMIELPYKDGRMSMLVLLPKHNIDELEKNLTSDNLNKWTKQLSGEKVELYLPKFKLALSYGLIQELQNLGITDAFSEGTANFSKITGKPDLYISKVIQDSFIDVNEKGTESAAVTVVVFTMKSIFHEKPDVFKADHPFIFIIKDNKTDLILFVGKFAGK